MARVFRSYKHMIPCIFHKHMRDSVYSRIIVYIVQAKGDSFYVHMS